ncbi:hypothetical protein RvY_04406 [Ramazzottius varieornatus]|uniref:Uncharacterized protein n=1 Tax=Ramazzottius varieornatus TaxID=947166 RepID=A0A1D1UUX3_RAMVA|nr:hypothetical protein RvY_04406 [Ramazzottius varieornatus]
MSEKFRCPDISTSFTPTSTEDFSGDELVVTGDTDNPRHRANDLLYSSKTQRDLMNHRIVYTWNRRRNNRSGARPNTRRIEK